MGESKQIQIALIGFGTVGTGLVHYFQSGNAREHGIALKKVAVSDLTKPREIDFPHVTDRVEEILSDPEISIVVELIGGEEPSSAYLLEAMERGKSVVTANKALLSRHMRQLFDAARECRVDFAFEASVAASIPLIRILKGFGGEPISRISGILNGTSNYILTQMGQGLDFESALSQAVEYGYAEADHILDTGGYDARDKLAIIASLVYDTEIKPEDIYCEGINSITPVDLDFAAKHGVEEGEAGYSIKSLATAQMKDGLLTMHVYPALISRTHPLASVQNELNAIYLHGQLSGPQLFQGRGAGREATTSAVVSDIIRVAENQRRGVVDTLPELNSNVVTADVATLERKGYVRINLRHVPGSIATASRIMADHGFNIEDSMQRRRFQFRVNEEMVIPDIVTVEPLPYSTVLNALKELEESDNIDGKPFFLRFEE